jgi:hypothetical protein
MQALEPHATALSKLRRKIERLGTAGAERRTLAFGIEAIDRALPGGGLALGAVHVLRNRVGPINSRLGETPWSRRHYQPKNHPKTPMNQ